MVASIVAHPDYCQSNSAQSLRLPAQWRSVFRSGVRGNIFHLIDELAMDTSAVENPKNTLMRLQSYVHHLKSKDRSKEIPSLDATALNTLSDSNYPTKTVYYCANCRIFPYHATHTTSPAYPPRGCKRPRTNNWKNLALSQLSFKERARWLLYLGVKVWIVSKLMLRQGFSPRDAKITISMTRLLTHAFSSLMKTSMLSN